MSLVIDVQNVSKHFGKATAVNQVSFGVEKGQIFGLLGPNGAGKTTTIRMINHILNPDTGSISILGEAVSPKSQERIGYLPEERGLYKKMKVFDQLMYLAQLKGLSQTAAKTAIEFWLDRFEASSWKKKEVSELSKGMSQKIQFIATVAEEPHSDTLPPDSRLGMSEPSPWCQGWYCLLGVLAFVTTLAWCLYS